MELGLLNHLSTALLALVVVGGFVVLAGDLSVAPTPFKESSLARFW